MDVLSLMMLTQRLTQKPGVRVHFDINGKAYSYAEKGQYVIGVPLLDDSMESNQLMRGYLDHEAAHVLFTDFPTWVSKSDPYSCNTPTQIIKDFANIYEDVRVERLMGMTYAGSRYNLKILATQCFTSKRVMETIDKVNALMQKSYHSAALTLLAGEALLFYQRSLLVSSFTKDASLLLALLEYPQFERLVELIKTPAVSTADSFELAKALYEEIKSVVKDADLTELSKFLLKVYEGDDPVLPPISQIYNDAVLSGMQQTISKIVNDKHLNLCSKEALRMLQMCGEFNTASAKDLDAPCLNCTDNLMCSADLASIHRLSAHVRRVLVPVLQSMQYRPGYSGWYGSLDSRRLHRTGVGDGRVFSTKAQRVVRRANVAMLCDCSGSMEDELIDASIAMYAMWEALSVVPGLCVKSYTFSHSVSKIPSIKLGRYPVLRAGGGTKLAGAILHVMKDFVSHSDRRHILFVFTDGVPDNPEATHEAIRMARNMDVELYGISIDCNYLEDFLSPEDYIVVKNVQTEFAPALQKLMTRALKRALAA